MTIYDETDGSTLVDADGNAIASSTSAPAGTERGLIVRNIPSGIQPVSATALPLPTGAATEVTLALIKAGTDKIISAPSTEATVAANGVTLAAIKLGTDKIPSSPATDRATAAAPVSTRLSDGAAFYDGTKTGQLPAALVGGRLDVVIGAAGTIATESTLSGIKTGTDKIPSSPATDRSTAVAPASVRLSDGAAFYAGATEGTLASIKTGTDKIPSSPSTDRATAAAPASVRLSDGSAFYAGATETTVAAIKTGTDKIPSSPATDRSTAAAPFSARLSDGAAFYAAPAAAQLPAALVSGRLDVNVGGVGTLATETTLASIKTGTDKIPSSPATDRATAAAPASVRLSDGSAFYAGATETTLSGIKTGTDKIPSSPSTDRATAAAPASVRLSDGAAFYAGATESTLAGIKTGTDKIPSSPATDRATAAAPFSVRLSDGSAFYDGTKTGQLPTALVASRLDVNTGAWLGSTAPTVGQKAMASSIPVVVSSDQSNLPIRALTSADVVTAAQGAPAAQANAWFVKPRQLASYSAMYRLASRPFALSWASGGAARKQWASIYHAVGATKTMRIRRVSVSIESASAAAIVMLDLVRLTAATTPATGNPVITPSPHAATDTVEATCLALPTTAGVEGTLIASAEWNLGITATGSVINPPPPLTEVLLYDDRTDAEVKPLEIPLSTAGGFAVMADASASATIKGYVRIHFTEE